MTDKSPPSANEAAAEDGAPAAGPTVPAARAAAAFASKHSGRHPPDEAGPLYRLLVESVRDYAIFALDTTGHILTWNTGAQRFKGYLANEILGKHFSVFYPDEDQWKPARELEIATAEGRFEEEGWRIRKDGSRFWASVVITALRDERGDLVGFAKVTRDLTERKQAMERELESARRVAVSEEANRSKATFLAAMSHELRTPLNAIAGYADLLLLGVGGGISEQHKDYLQRIRSSQQHLLSIINDILNYSRIEAGQLKYDIGQVSLRGVIDRVVPMIEPQARLRNLQLERWHGPDVITVADRAKVEQVLLNLLSNAVKFTPAGGHIVIECGSRGDQAVMSVRDTGVGIPTEHLGSIFEPFVQVGRSLTSPHEGTGLGLAISSDLAKGMGGTLEVSSTVGEGSTFTLALPIALSTKR
jgi:PAS domain S-box-containing protein